MNIAYIITAYMDSKQLSRLIESLGEQDFFIHVDKKIDITEFVDEAKKIKKNIKFIKNRTKIGWGGYSQVNSLIELLKEVREIGKEYDRVVCLSGTDYPIKSFEYIEDEFIANKDRQYMNACRISKNNNQNWRIIKYWKFDVNILNNKMLSTIYRRIYNKIISNIYYFIGKRKKDYVIINGKECDVFFGSDYWSLTYSCAMYVLDTIEKNKKMQKYFKTSFVPSELMIQTIVCNSPFSKYANILIKNDLRYEELCSLHYEIYDKKIKVFTVDDYDEIIHSNKLFFRKAYSGISDNLIKKINEWDGNKNDQN